MYYKHISCVKHKLNSYKKGIIIMQIMNAVFIICLIIIGFGIWKMKQSCWHKNISVGDTALVKSLLDKGADINATDEGLTLLMKVATEGYLKTAKLLIDKKADIDTRSNEGGTALIAASMAGYAKIVELLVNAGANTKLKNKMGYTAEMYAKEKGYTNIIELLNKVGG
jgi:ankyrin repeat protein